ncbi:MBL fold metallo-hydrolase [Marinilabiliaceae bacterium JC017]|nr:MBL fold metallo-hydrolase [Marinilabiliaceae bacterium JC017]
MKLSVLTENFAGGRFQAEHGLSYFIEYKNKRILFDTGNSDLFLANAAKLGIDIEKDADTVILSHGHWDHGDGLRYIKNKPLICHPSAFMARYRKRDMSYIGLSLTRKEVEEQFQLITTAQPYRIDRDIIFLGEIPSKNNFERQTTTFVDKKGEPDFVPDDTALAIIKDNELVVVTACSHAGICNIVDYAMEVSGIRQVKAVIGGFHLKKNDAQTKETIRYMKELNIKEIRPSHCTDLPAMAAFHEAFECEQVKTGMVFNF